MMRLLKRAGVLLGLVCLALTGGWFLLGFTCVSFGEVPTGFRAEDRLDALFADVLREGRVDYDGVRAFGDQSGADELAAFYGRPGVAPSDAKLAAALNAYNVTVLAFVARRGPQYSIHEVRGVIEPEPGFGFFYAQWFKFDGSWTNLYDLENEVIRSFGDARIHAAINCASTSCPSLHERAFRAELLDDQLDEAARRFVSDPRHVRFDGAGTLHLSAIFEWFASDFEGHRLPSGERGLRAFIDAFCESPTCVAPRDAELRYNEYDWSLNAVRESAQAAGD
ncbi:MAG: hypothetical protein ACI9KE_006745 [Polyangiales bacterium]|jgi:hypothetical protein